MKLVKVNDSFGRVEYLSTESENFSKLYSFFRVRNPALTFTPKVRAKLDDGKRPFVFKNGLFLIGIVDKIRDFLKEHSIDYEDTIPPFKQKINIEYIEKFINMMDFSFELYEHQKRGFKIAFEEKRAILQAATGAGKSAIIYMIGRYAIAKQKRMILVVPDVGLAYQMRSDFYDYFYSKEKTINKELETEIDKERIGYLKQQLDKIQFNREKTRCNKIEDFVHMIVAGEDKYIDVPVIITTWQSVYQLSQDYFDKFDILVVDEAHKAKASSIKEIATKVGQNRNDFSTMKIGFTGTVSNNFFDQLMVESSLGPAVQIVSPKELMDLGLATYTSIQPIILKYNSDTRKLVHKMTWPEENKFIMENEVRTKFIADFALKLVSKGNVLVIAKNIALQKSLFEMIKPKNKNSYFISGSVKGEKREQARKEFDQNQNSIMVGSIQIVSTGLNMKSLKYIILAQVTKSEIVTIQTLGRAMRLHESKEKSIIFDFVDDIVYTTRFGNEKDNYYLKHFRERMSAYQKYEFDVAPPISFVLEDEMF